MEGKHVIAFLFAVSYRLFCPMLRCVMKWCLGGWTLTERLWFGSRGSWQKTRSDSVSSGIWSAYPWAVDYTQPRLDPQEEPLLPASPTIPSASESTALLLFLAFWYLCLSCWECGGFCRQSRSTWPVLVGCRCRSWRAHLLAHPEGLGGLFISPCRRPFSLVSDGLQWQMPGGTPLLAGCRFLCSPADSFRRW